MNKTILYGTVEDNGTSYPAYTSYLTSCGDNREVGNMFKIVSMIPYMILLLPNFQNCQKRNWMVVD